MQKADRDREERGSARFCCAGIARALVRSVRASPVPECRRERVRVVARSVGRLLEPASPTPTLRNYSSGRFCALCRPVMCAAAACRSARASRCRRAVRASESCRLLLPPQPQLAFSRAWLCIWLCAKLQPRRRRNTNSERRRRRPRGKYNKFARMKVVRAAAALACSVWFGSFVRSFVRSLVLEHGSRV